MNSIRTQGEVQMGIDKYLKAIASSERYVFSTKKDLDSLKSSRPWQFPVLFKVIPGQSSSIFYISYCIDLLSLSQTSICKQLFDRFRDMARKSAYWQRWAVWMGCHSESSVCLCSRNAIASGPIWNSFFHWKIAARFNALQNHLAGWKNPFHGHLHHLVP